MKDGEGQELETDHEFAFNAKIRVWITAKSEAEAKEAFDCGLWAPLGDYEVTGVLSVEEMEEEVLSVEEIGEEE